MSGVDEPDCVLTYDIQRDVSVLYIPQISAEEAVWFGSGMNLDEAREKYDVDLVRWSSDLPNHLSKWVNDNTESPIYLLNASLGPLNLTLEDELYDMTSLAPAVRRRAHHQIPLRDRHNPTRHRHLYPRP